MKKAKRNNQHGPKGLHIFQTIEQNIAAWDFTPHQQKQNNNRKLSAFQTIVIAIISIEDGNHCVFFFHEAKEIDEYMDVVFELTIDVGVLITFISFFLKNDALFQITELTTKELNDSKLQPTRDDSCDDFYLSQVKIN